MRTKINIQSGHCVKFWGLVVLVNIIIRRNKKVDPLAEKVKDIFRDDKKTQGTRRIKSVLIH